MTFKLVAWFQNVSSWTSLSRFRNSFLSKATTAFSLATFGLANLALPLTSLGISTSSLKFLFVGSLLFLSGYILLLWRIPPEFRSETEIDKIVHRMSVLDSDQFYRSRLDIASALLQRFQHKIHRSYLQAPILFLQQQVTAAEKASSKENVRGLYHADLALRKYDFPGWRCLVFLLLLAGLLLLFVPTMVSFAKAFLNFSTL